MKNEQERKQIMEHDKLAELLNPIFDFMQQEYPKNAKLVIEPYSAQIIYEHQEDIWLSKKFDEDYKNFSNKMKTLVEDPTIKELLKEFCKNDNSKKEDGPWFVPITDTIPMSFTNDMKIKEGD